MSSRDHEPSDERVTDDADPSIDEIFEDGDFEEVGPVSVDELEWETDTESDDGERDAGRTAASNTPMEPSTAGGKLSPEALARLRDCRPELERVADSDLPAESIAKELLRILNQQEEPT